MALGPGSKASCKRTPAPIALPYASFSTVASAAVAALLGRAASRTDTAHRHDMRRRTLGLRLRERRHRLQFDDVRPVPDVILLYHPKAVSRMNTAALPLANPLLFAI